MYHSESSLIFSEFTQDGLELNHIKRELELPTENEMENQEWVHMDEKYFIKDDLHGPQSSIIFSEFTQYGLESNHIKRELELPSENETENREWVHLDEKYLVKEDTYRLEPSITFSEGTQDHIELNHIKRELEMPSESETKNFEWVDLDKKDHIKEDVEIFDEKCNVVDHDFETNSFNEEYNIENVKFESSNDNDVINITNIEESEMMTIDEKVISNNARKCPRCSYTCKKPFQVKKHFLQVHLEIRDFACPHCDYAAKQKTHLQKHIRCRHDNKPAVIKNRSKLMTADRTPKKTFSCTLCPYSAKRSSRLKTHFSMVHSNIRSFECPHCDYAAKAKDILNTHILNKHEDISGVMRIRHICHICEKTFTDKSNLRNHIKFVHLMTKVKCSECSYEGNNPKVLKAHILLVHHPENLFMCYNCEYKSAYKNKLKSHILENHVFDMKSIVKCEYCSFTSKSKLSLDAHIEEHHIKKGLFKCLHCEYETECLNDLNNHVKVNHNNIDFVCTICGKYRSKHEKNVRIHMSRVHCLMKIGKNEPIASRKACTLCPFIGKSPSALRNHINQVHLEIRSFRCPYCNYIAKQNSHLNRHLLNMHEDQAGKVRRKLVCHLCEKEFRKKYSLKQHIEVVHLYANVRRFPCPYCDYAAKQNSALKTHISGKHEGQAGNRRKREVCHLCEREFVKKYTLKAHLMNVHFYASGLPLKTRLNSD